MAKAKKPEKALNYMGKGMAYKAGKTIADRKKKTKSRLGEIMGSMPSSKRNKK